MGVSGVHYPRDTGAELHAVYHFVSSRTTAGCGRGEHARQRPAPAVADRLYPTCNWHEREPGLLGIIFDGHPALTRIEMPDDWGHPQRKDYPLGGNPRRVPRRHDPATDERRHYQ